MERQAENLPPALHHVSKAGAVLGNTGLPGEPDEDFMRDILATRVRAVQPVRCAKHEAEMPLHECAKTPL